GGLGGSREGRPAPEVPRWRARRGLQRRGRSLYPETAGLPPLHLLRLHALLRGDDRGHDLPLPARQAGALCAHRTARDPRDAGRHRPARRAGGTPVAQCASPPAAPGARAGADGPGLRRPVARHQRERARPARLAGHRRHGDAARVAPGHRPGILPDDALWQVRARRLSRGGPAEMVLREAQARYGRDTRVNDESSASRLRSEPWYLPVGDEIEIFEAAYAARLPVLLKGPTGCGKTRFVEHMAWRLYRQAATHRRSVEVPLVTVACHEELTATDLVGRHLLAADATVWTDGPLTRAVRSGAILYLDEIVEARTDTTVVIHSLTDHRRMLPIDRTGELLDAHPDFLLVISYNPGYQSALKDLKTSTRQRFVSIEFDYPPPEAEARIIAHEGGVDDTTARSLARIGAKVRALREHGFDEGVSTRLLVYAASLVRQGIAPRRGERRRRGAAGGGRHRRIHPAAGRDRPGPLNRIAALGLFACAIRGGPVELVEPDAADAQVHWSDAALAIVLADARAAARLP